MVGSKVEQQSFNLALFQVQGSLLNFKTSCFIFIEKNLDVNVVLIFDQMNIFVLEYPYEVINKSSLLIVKYFVDRTHLSELATTTVAKLLF